MSYRETIRKLDNRWFVDIDTMVEWLKERNICASMYRLRNNETLYLIVEAQKYPAIFKVRECCRRIWFKKRYGVIIEW